MQLLEHDNCTDYLREHGLLDAGEDVTVQPLFGGVSNVVFHVQRQRGDAFVLKQAREQLRVEQPWFCSVERIWREVDVLQICHRILTSPATNPGNLSGSVTTLVPQVLFEDRDNYAFAMTAAPVQSTWKQRLMRNEFSHALASACGRMLGQLHAGTWRDASVAEHIGDRQYFDQLRVDPYYRHVAATHPGLRSELLRLIVSLDENCCCLVHGDFSPKNLLVWDDPAPHLMLIDCEVGHYGDPAFDLGFMLSHLTLKSVYFRWKAPDAVAPVLTLPSAFWSAYEASAAAAVSPAELDVLQQRAVRNLAACLLARVDGKSPVEYLNQDRQHDFVRRLSQGLFANNFGTMMEALEWIGDAHSNDHC